MGLLPDRIWQKALIFGWAILLPSLAACALLVCLAPYLYSFGFCYPRGDDYDGITRAMFLFDLPGALYEIGREWLFWSGRYTYHFLAVFLGKAAENRFACGLACFSVLMAYAYGFYKFGRLAGQSIKQGIFFSLLCACVLLCCHGNLTDFYLLTDALTIVLQAAFYLLATGQLLKIFNNRGEKRGRPNLKLFIAFSILAIGTYEHAALAIFWTYCAALAFTYLLWPAGEEAALKIRQGLLSCAPWLMGALLFSFLAPGNAQRRAARHVDLEQQLAQFSSAPEQLVNFLRDFILSPWPIATLCVCAIGGLCLKRPDTHFQKRLTLCIVPLVGFLLFAFSVITLHALSDVPFTAEIKLQASLELYASIALGLTIRFLPWGLPAYKCGNIFITLACSGPLFCIAANSANFQKTFYNAANGEMLLLADFMAERRQILAKASRSTSYVPDSFGLRGELRNPAVRKRKIWPGECATVITGFPRAVFPVYTLPDLKADPAGWPNIWAAWVYGLPALAEIPPQSRPVLKAIAEGKGQPISIGSTLREAGLASAWLYLDEPHSDSAAAWLVLESSKAIKINILLPMRPNKARLLPIQIQKNAWLTLESETILHATPFTRLSSLSLNAALSPGVKTALWLESGIHSSTLPKYLFASANALVYYKLSVSK